MSASKILDQMGIQRWRLRAQSSPVTGAPSSGTGDQSGAPAQQRDELTDAGRSALPPEPTTPTATTETSSGRLTGEGMDWQQLRDLLEQPATCPECAGADPILGSGDECAHWFFLIDAPGKHDLQRQQLLSGRAGQLFDGILQALQLNRQSVYLTSVYKCPQSGKQHPVTGCGKLFQQQIRLVQPQLVVALGEAAAQAAIKANEPLSELRAKPQKCYSNDLPIVATYGLAEMLMDPALKAEAWHDLKTALSLAD